jgi:hypothetical protein
MNLSFSYMGSLLFLALAVVGTTIVGSSSTNQAWADVIEGTEGPDFLFGTPADDVIDSKAGDDFNFGDGEEGDNFGDDIILSGEGDDLNIGDTFVTNGDASGDDVIISGEGDDINAGDTIGETLFGDLLEMT